MRACIASFLVSALLFTPAATDAKAAKGEQLPIGPWRMFRMFEPVPAPQRGYEIWVRDADLVAAARQHDKVVAVTVLAIHNDPSTGELKKLTFGEEEFDCEETRVRAVTENEIVSGNSRPTRSEPEEWQFLMPHTFRAWAFPAICEGSRFDDKVLAADVEAALEVQRGLDREFAAASAGTVDK